MTSGKLGKKGGATILVQKLTEGKLNEPFPNQVDIKLTSDQPGVHQSDQQRAGPAQTDPRLTAGRRGPTFSGGERRDHHPPQSQD